MKQSLKNYLRQTREILSDPEIAQDQGRLSRLLERHKDAVSAFQHERFIHLIVTLFFALLLIVSIAGTLWRSSFAFLALDALIGIMLVFYIYHYYFLENYVQKLYAVTETIYLLLEKCGENK